jgi:hypothetical protein
MRFQTTLSQPVTPTVGVSTQTIQRAVKKTASGRSMWIIAPGIEDIILVTLVVSWNNLQVLGELQITGADPDPVMILMQTAAADKEVIDFHELPVHLGNHGLQAVNNSIGGHYAITGIYR